MPRLAWLMQRSCLYGRAFPNRSCPLTANETGTLDVLKTRRLVKQGGNPKPGNRFVAEFFDLVARPAVDRLAPLDMRGKRTPMSGLPAKDGPLESRCAARRA